MEIEDLLGRDPVKIDLQLIASFIAHKTVLVTGAGGSIGSELCRQLVQLQPSRLLLLGHGENSIYRIEMELLQNCIGFRLGDEFGRYAKGMHARRMIISCAL